jgi:hypothetical protein
MAGSRAPVDYDVIGDVQVVHTSDVVTDGNDGADVVDDDDDKSRVRVVFCESSVVSRQSAGVDERVDT